MTNYRVENGRRDFLLAIAGGIAGLVAASSPGPVFAQTASGPTLSMSTIGAGREGGALGALFVKAGHPVMFSSRHPDTLKGLIDELGPLARAGTVAEAVEFGDVVMVVVPYTALEQIGKDYGNALAKKVLVIDVSNPIARRDGAAIVEWVDEQGGAGLATAKLLPGAHIVRAFNAINYAKLSADAHRQGELVGVPIAGDDARY
jgi:predicted dinucleotide-binding enzyme